MQLLSNCYHKAQELAALCKESQVAKVIMKSGIGCSKSKGSSLFEIILAAFRLKFQG